MLLAIGIVAIIGFLISTVGVFTADGRPDFLCISNAFLTAIIAIAWWNIALPVSIVAMILGGLTFALFLIDLISEHR